MKRIQELDRTVLFALHHWAQGAPWRRLLTIALARWLIWAMYGTVGLLILVYRGYVVAGMVGVVLMAGILANVLLGTIVVRQRPFVTHKDRVKGMVSPRWLGKSFPSDHAMAAFAVALPLLDASLPLGIGMVVAAGLVAIARVLAGLHYPSDITVGASVSVLIYLALRSF